jgi:hypothetical protein
MAKANTLLGVTTVQTAKTDKTTHYLPLNSDAVDQQETAL